MTERKKASASTLAKKSKQPKSYGKPYTGASENLKEFPGVLLLRLATGQAEPSGWRLFEVLLRQYYRSRGSL